MFGNARKTFCNIPISDNCGLKIRFRILICNLHWTLFALVLHILHWCYSSTALLSANQNRVFGSLRKIRKTAESSHFLKIFENFRKSLEVFGNARKTFCNIPISDNYGLKIRFRILICNLHWTLFALVLHILH